MCSIILYGTGYKANMLMDLLEQVKIRPLFCVDSNQSKQGGTFRNVEIKSPKELHKYDDKLIFIAATDTGNEIWNFLLKEGIQEGEIRKFYEAVLWVLKTKWNAQPLKNKSTSSVIFDVINGYHAGGVEEWSRSVALELSRMYKNIYLVGLEKGAEVEENCGLNTIRIKIDEDNTWSITNIYSIAQELYKYLPFQIITGSQNITFFAALLLRKLYPDDVSLISVVHQGMNQVYKEYADAEKDLSKIIGVSLEIEEGLLAQGILESKVNRISCPVEIENDLIRKFSTNNDSIKIGYAGRIVKGQKRLDLLPCLIKELERLHIDYQLEIAGAGAYREELSSLLSDNPRVFFLGQLNRSSIPDFWKNQDVCINLSDHEGRSLSVVEAMANGAVPIVTHTSGITEDITDGENGFIVSLRDYKKIAEKIMYLNEHRQQIQKMGMEAYERIRTKCDMIKHVRYWQQLLKLQEEEESS